MGRKAIYITIGIVLGVVALLLALPIFNSVRITPPMIGIPLIITRNGQELPPDRIRSVQYRIDVKLTQPPQEVQSTSLKEAHREQDYYYILGASFSIYRTGFIFESVEVKPQFRSIFLRITFTDGKIVSMGCPIISDTRENQGLYVDLSDGSQSIHSSTITDQ